MFKMGLFALGGDISLAKIWSFQSGNLLFNSKFHLPLEGALVCFPQTHNQVFRQLFLTWRRLTCELHDYLFQDCNHAETASVIRSYGDQVVFIQQPDQSEPVVPKNEKKFKGYFKIARHYGWALNQTFVQQVCSNIKSSLKMIRHNFPIYHECQTQLA